jgi:hypothetical protein
MKRKVAFAMRYRSAAPGRFAECAEVREVLIDRVRAMTRIDQPIDIRLLEARATSESARLGLIESLRAVISCSSMSLLRDRSRCFAAPDLPSDSKSLPPPSVLLRTALRCRYELAVDHPRVPAAHGDRLDQRACEGVERWHGRRARGLRDS